MARNAEAVRDAVDIVVHHPVVDGMAPIIDECITDLRRIADDGQISETEHDDLKTRLEAKLAQIS